MMISHMMYMCTHTITVLQCPRHSWKDAQRAHRRSNERAPHSLVLYLVQCAYRATMISIVLAWQGHQQRMHQFAMMPRLPHAGVSLVLGGQLRLYAHTDVGSPWWFSECHFPVTLRQLCGIAQNNRLPKVLCCTHGIDISHDIMSS